MEQGGIWNEATCNFQITEENIWKDILSCSETRNLQDTKFKTISLFSILQNDTLKITLFLLPGDDIVYSGPKNNFTARDLKERTEYEFHVHARTEEGDESLPSDSSSITTFRASELTQEFFYRHCLYVNHQAQIYLQIIRESLVASILI